MRSILLTHARRYPLMKPVDAVKLIYQNEFGGGHLIRDGNACLSRLLKEYSAVSQRGDLPLLEAIGNNMFRVQLAALDRAGYDPEALCRDFIRSAAIHRGDAVSFRAKLSLLEALTAAGHMPFSSDALSGYLKDYERAGFPPVSHSECYRNAYSPAYRILEKSCLPEPFLLLRD